MTVDRTPPVTFLHSWNSFIYGISTNMIQIDLNDLIGFCHKSIQSFHGRSVVTFLTIRRFLILWAHLISYLCSILIWSNRIVIDVVSFKDTIKKTLKIGLFVSGHQGPSSEAAVFNTKGLIDIQSNIKFITYVYWLGNQIRELLHRACFNSASAAESPMHAYPCLLLG